MFAKYKWYFIAGGLLSGGIAVYFFFRKKNGGKGATRLAGETPEDNTAATAKELRTQSLVNDLEGILN